MQLDRSFDRPVQLRLARHTQRLDDVVAFYRDGLGLPETGRFKDHDGYDGVFLAIPGTGAHLEFTSGGFHGAPQPHAESLLVLYVGDASAMRDIAIRLGTGPVPSLNPYWARHALTFEDPDGFRVVIVPGTWSARGAAAGVRIVEHSGPRAELRRLFDFAESSARALDEYIDRGRVLVALSGDAIVGHVQLTETGRASELELKNMAVDPALRGRGVGRALVESAAELARAEWRSALLVATAGADVGNLRFYQRVGFRIRSIERDVFNQAAGYEPLSIGGIPVRDRVWLDRALSNDESSVGTHRDPGRRSARSPAAGRPPGGASTLVSEPGELEAQGAQLRAR
jgi:ribosomal protein S18 acetylase RimI-like enzyme